MKELINITIKVEDGEKFDELLIDFLEKNTLDYDLELKQILTGDERKKVVDMIRNSVKKNGIQWEQ